ncbi:MAG: DUF58 domain-containing protein [Myxococcales bacterium]|nr:DUF58 domain-containing protein [Myxococcales bacterium]
MTDDLLTAGELAELDRLRRHLAFRTATDAQGAQASRRRGQSPEFVDHRPYAPGDDLRRLDWNVLARSDQTVIKRYRAEEEAAVRIAVDVTGSMGIGEPPKLPLALKIAAAVAYLALSDGERAQVASLSRRGVDLSPAKRGRGQFGALHALLGRFDADPPGEESPMPDATMGELLRRCGRSGVLVVITDALAPRGDIDAWPRALVRAKASGHDVRLIQVLAPDDIDPPWDSDLELVDAETGGTIDVTFDAEARAAYAHRLEALVAALREGCRRARASYARAQSDEALAPVVRRLAAGGID